MKRAIKLSLWGATLGTVGAILLVLLFRATQSPIIYKFFGTVDALAFFAASHATSLFFPGDRVQRVLSITVFFDLMLVLFTGIQCALLGFCVGLVLHSKDEVINR